MKHLFTLFLAAISFSTLATIHTVDNKENSGADFTDLQAAIDAATTGDTIYVSGSPTSYGSITLNKQLVLFGQGYKPNNQFGSITEIGNVTLDFVVFPSSDPSGSHIEGFYTATFTLSDSESQISDVTIRRNHLSSVELGNGNFDIIIEHNIIRSSVGLGSGGCFVNGTFRDGPCTTNIIVRNNIFHGSSSSINGAYSNTHLITNNLFVESTNQDAIRDCNTAIISNNIFFGPSVGTDDSDCDFCTLTNNLSFGPNATDFDYGTNTTGSNLEATDPQFVDAPTDFDFDDNGLVHDFRLQEGSPAINAGSDGTDIGIFGGSNPFPITETDAGFFLSPFPGIPQVTEMNILNASIPENGTLNVEFKAKKSN